MPLTHATRADVAVYLMGWEGEHENASQLGVFVTSPIARILFIAQHSF